MMSPNSEKCGIVPLAWIAHNLRRFSYRDVALDFRATAQATNFIRGFYCSRLGANVAIRGRRRKTSGAIDDDVCIILLHEI